jgi:hypothetical protein
MKWQIFYMQVFKDQSHMNLILFCRCDDGCYQASILPIPKHKKNNETTESSLEHAEPLVSFALYSGNWSNHVVSVGVVIFLMNTSSPSASSLDKFTN